MNFTLEAHQAASRSCQRGKEIAGLDRRRDFKGPRESGKRGNGIPEFVNLSFNTMVRNYHVSQYS